MLLLFYLFLLCVFTIVYADGRCGHPGIPKYGGLTTVSKKYYNEGDLVFYRCDPLFVLYGNDTRKCQQNGSWSGEVPFCLRRAKPGANILFDGNFTSCLFTAYTAIKVLPASYLTTLKFIFSNGTVVITPIIHCQDGVYPTTFEANEGILRVCGILYSINKHYALCEIEILVFKGAQDCGTPDSPVNAESSLPSEMGRAVISKTTCVQDRFVLVGNATRVCDDFGKWSEEHQYCKALYCEDLTQVEKDSGLNISYEPPLGTDDVLPAISTRPRYSCSEGFVLNGESERKCLSNGTWSGNKPACVPDGSYCTIWKVIGIAGISILGFILLAFVGYFILLFCRKRSQTNN